MAERPKTAIDVIRAIHHLAERHLAQAGADDPIVKAARAVVWARYKPIGDWKDLNEAIGRLEDLVGRPQSEEEI